MKKKMMVLGGLLMAVAITGYSVSGTYAKYISALDTITDSARVAKFSFKLQDKDGADWTDTTTVYLFITAYNNNAIQSADTDKVIGPGATGEYTFTINGTAETAYTVKIAAEATDKDGNAINSDLADQIKFTLTKNGTAVSGVEKVSLATLVAELNKTDGSAIVAANTALNDTYKINWEWAFDDASATKDEVTNANNQKDTGLGSKETLDTIKLTIDVTVAQSATAPTMP